MFDYTTPLQSSSTESGLDWTGWTDAMVHVDGGNISHSLPNPVLIMSLHAIYDQNNNNNNHYYLLSTLCHQRRPFLILLALAHTSPFICPQPLQICNLIRRAVGIYKTLTQFPRPGPDPAPSTHAHIRTSSIGSRWSIVIVYIYISFWWPLLSLGVSVP